MGEALVLPKSQERRAPVAVDIAGAWNLAVAGTGYYDLDTEGTAAARPSDIVIPDVKAGDFIEFGVSLYSAAAVNAHYIAVATIVAGAQVKLVAPQSWMILSGVVSTPSGSIQIPLDAGDIENGSVRLRLRANRISGTAARTVGFSTPMKVWGRGPF